MTEKLPRSGRAYLDDESRAILYQGASVNQLAELFKVRPPDVMRKLADLKPVGEGRQGNPIYNVAEAAARLVKIPITEDMITAHLRRMNPKELPALLNKLFWDGMAARRKYEELIGDLWMTSDVMAVASDSFQSIRTSLLLIPDMLRDETEISEPQLLLVQRVIDDGLEQLHERLVSDLRKPSGSRSRPDVAEDEPL